MASPTNITGSKGKPEITICQPGANCDVTITNLASSRNDSDAPKFGYKTKVKSEIFSAIANPNGSVDATLTATARGKIKSVIAKIKSGVVAAGDDFTEAPTGAYPAATIDALYTANAFGAKGSLAAVAGVDATLRAPGYVHAGYIVGAAAKAGQALAGVKSNIQTPSSSAVQPDDTAKSLSLKVYDASAIGLIESHANGAYMAPGNAITGVHSVVNASAGAAYQYWEASSEADLGSSTTGVYLKTNAGSEAKNILKSIKSTADAGVALGGVANIAISGGGANMAIDSLEASNAVGPAIAGGLNVALSSRSNKLGDYEDDSGTDDEVTARVYGRGPAVAGLLNLGHSTNGDSEITTDVVASANMGSALGGLVSIANAWGKGSADATVNVATLEGQAVAFNLGATQSTEWCVCVLLGVCVGVV